MLGHPTLVKDCSYADRTTMTTTIDHAVSAVKAETILATFPERSYAHIGTSLGMVGVSDAR